jgi:hypothetical protein
MTHQTALRTNGPRVRWLCTCGAGTGVTGDKQSEPMPVEYQWGTIPSSERVAGRTHMQKFNK